MATFPCDASTPLVNVAGSASPEMLIVICKLTEGTGAFVDTVEFARLPGKVCTKTVDFVVAVVLDG